MAQQEIKPGYTRVTEIFSVWGGWDKIPKEILEYKMLVGTDVHEIIHMHNSCLPVTFNYPESEFYFESYLAWANEYNIIVKQSETRLYCDALKITGQIDAIVKFPDDDRLILCDWKTTASYTKRTALSWAMQGAFYYYLLEKNDVPNISEKFIFVQLSPDGKTACSREFVYTNKLMNSCINALETYRYFNPEK